MSDAGSFSPLEDARVSMSRTNNRRTPTTVVNPRTGRSIRVGGAVHAALVREMGVARPPRARPGPTVKNPLTGRSIRVGGATHRAVLAGIRPRTAGNCDITKGSFWRLEQHRAIRVRQFSGHDLLWR